MTNSMTNLVGCKTVVYQVSEEALRGFGESIFLALWQKLSNQSDKPAKYYSRAECCSILRCSMPTFHALVNKGFVPITKVGRKTLVNADVFDSIVASGELAKYKRHSSISKNGGTDNGK